MDTEALSLSQSYTSAEDDYRNILKICRSGTPVPPISLLKTKEILNSIRPSVTDLYSISGHHYVHGGNEALEHLHFLLNGVIQDLNNITVDELNMTWACIVYKGHS